MGPGRTSTTRDPGTPEHLLPRLGNHPISNSRFLRSAVLTRVVAGDPSGVPTRWRAATVAGPTAHVGAVAFSPDGALLAVGAGAQLRLLDTATLDDTVTPLEQDGDVASVAFSPQGDRLVTATGDAVVQTWTVAGEAIARVEGVTDPRVVGAQFGPEDRVVVGGDGMGLTALADDMVTGAPMAELDTDGLLFVRVQPHTWHHALAYLDGSVRMHGWDRWQPTGVRATPPHTATVTALTVGPPDQVASGDHDGMVRVWDPVTGRPTSARLEGHGGADIMALAFSGDGRFLVSLGDDGRAVVWDHRASQQSGEALAVPGRGVCLAVHPEGSMVAVGDDTGALTVWTDVSHEVDGPLLVPPPRRAAGVARPAVGVLLTHEQAWRMDGLALGDLLHSLSLAPGEITQIAVTDHTQRVLQNSADAVDASDTASRSGSGDSTLVDSEASTATQTSSGVTTATGHGATTESASTGLLAAIGVSGGDATTTTTGTQASVASGTRHVSDEANQNLHQSTQQAAAADRSRFAAAVREVSESDALELSTRVVANYNHMHALNLQYYEVLQVMGLHTTVVDAERLVFVPMTMIDFSDTDQARRALARFRRELSATVRTMGMSAVATCIDRLLAHDGTAGATFSSELATARLAQIWDEAEEQADAVASAAGRVAVEHRARDDAEMAVLEARDALRAAGAEDGLAHRAGLQRVLAADRARLAAATARSEEADAALARARASSEAAERVRRDLADMVAHLMTPSGTPAAGAPTPPTLTPEMAHTLETRVHDALADRGLAVNQGLWVRLDPSVYAGLLDGMAVEGEPLASTVDPNPVAVHGTSVAFRWHHADPAAAAEFQSEHVGAVDPREDAVALPTGAVFGEAVLGESNAADVVDITRFWNWNDALPPVRPAQVDALAQPADQPLAAPRLPTAPAAALDLGALTFPTVGSGIPAVTEALQNPDLFGDISGLKGSAAIATSAALLSADGAHEAAALANENLQRHLALAKQVARAVLDDSAASGSTDGDLDPTLAGAVLNSVSDEGTVARPGTGRADGAGGPAAGFATLGEEDA